MTQDQMRSALIQSYPHSLSWSGKVKRMADTQVIAIYLKFKSQGKV